MKSKMTLMAALIFCLFLIGCSPKNDASEPEAIEYYDILTEREYFPSPEELKALLDQDGGNHALRFLGMQFKDGEPVQIWSARNGGAPIKIYLYGLSGTPTLALENVSDQYIFGYHMWYMDRNGCFYCYQHNLDSDILLVKLDSTGSELYQIKYNDTFPYDITGVRELQDGRVYLILYKDSSNETLLGKLDPVSGAVSVLKDVELFPPSPYGNLLYLGAGKEEPAICTNYGFRELRENAEFEELMSFDGTSFTTHKGKYKMEFQIMQDFQVMEDGCVETVWSSAEGKEACMERLRLEKVMRIPITICGVKLSDWIKRQISRFNQTSDTYHIMVEECPEARRLNDADYAAAAEDFVTLTGIRTAAGNGPDIFVGAEILGNDVVGMAGKGVLEDLHPYMERSGIQETDYFSTVFDCWRLGTGIYGILPDSYLSLYDIEENLLPPGSETNMETLSRSLSIYEKPAVYMDGVSQRELLHHFLEGSDTLRGMVDWENGTCDFGTELFELLLENARRYGQTPGTDKRLLAKETAPFSFYAIESPSERAQRRRILSGGLFDDGIHAIANGLPVAINATSPNKEAAWEFLCYLLGEEAQSDRSDYPLKRDMYEGWVEKEFSRLTLNQLDVSQGFGGVTDGEKVVVSRHYKASDSNFIKQEKIPYFKEILEGARCLPVRTVPLLDIVCQEAEDYFSGSKSVEEVVAIIENRVNLYLGEHAQPKL